MNNLNIGSALQNYRRSFTALLFAIATAISPQSAFAEPVADPTTGTNVTQTGDQFDIDGGTQAGDNLFHSFEKFGLTKEQTANFLSNPDILNILGRVTGGDASIINGLIQVTGGDSNLFLINPAGFVFGENASLNLPASFTATTADGIQIGEFWFDALGENNYSNLFANPSGFAFATKEAGSIINSGNLSVNSGQTISLLGGLVVNTGTIEAPGGNIEIAAVEDKQLVTITPEGSLLSLALPVDAEGQLNSVALTPTDLPTLLASGGEDGATGVEITTDGSINLTTIDQTVAAEGGAIANSGNLIAAEINTLGSNVVGIEKADNPNDLSGSFSIQNEETVEEAGENSGEEETTADSSLEEDNTEAETTQTSGDVAGAEDSGEEATVEEEGIAEETVTEEESLEEVADEETTEETEIAANIDGDAEIETPEDNANEEPIAEDETSEELTEDDANEESEPVVEEPDAESDEDLTPLVDEEEVADDDLDLDSELEAPEEEEVVDDNLDLNPELEAPEEEEIVNDDLELEAPEEEDTEEIDDLAVEPESDNELITPDGTTGTVIAVDGVESNTSNITGGEQTDSNLVHNFARFDVEADTTANFVSEVGIENILASVTGDDVSQIDGNITVSGAESNLFLINPSGIIFGEGAELNLPASFTASTATSLINIDDPLLDINEGINNAGEIEVADGAEINLTGDSVINTGTLNAPNGSVKVTAQSGFLAGNVDIGEEGTLTIDPAVIEVVEEAGADDAELADGEILAEDGDSDEVFTVSADLLSSGTVVLEATDRISFNTNVEFEDLTARVAPEEGKTGVLEVFGTLRGSDIDDPENIPDRNLVLQNQNGDINITASESVPIGTDSFGEVIFEDPFEVEIISQDIQIEADNGNILVDRDVTAINTFNVNSINGNVTIGSSGSPKEIRVGFDTNGVDSGFPGFIGDREASTKISASTGDVELFGAINISQNGNLSVDAKSFAALKPISRQLPVPDAEGNLIRVIQDSNGRVVLDEEGNLLRPLATESEEAEELSFNSNQVVRVSLAEFAEQGIVIEGEFLTAQIDETTGEITGASDADGNFVGIDSLDPENNFLQNVRLLQNRGYNLAVTYNGTSNESTESILQGIEPNVRLRLQFPGDSSPVEVFSDPSDPDFDTSINITLFEDTSFTIGSDLPSSGLSDSIAILPVLNTDGSAIVGGISFGNGSFGLDSGTDGGTTAGGGTPGTDGETDGGTTAGGGTPGTDGETDGGTTAGGGTPGTDGGNDGGTTAGGGTPGTDGGNDGGTTAGGGTPGTDGETDGGTTAGGGTPGTDGGTDGGTTAGGGTPGTDGGNDGGTTAGGGTPGTDGGTDGGTTAGGGTPGTDGETDGGTTAGGGTPGTDGGTDGGTTAGGGTPGTDGGTDGGTTAGGGTPGTDGGTDGTDGGATADGGTGGTNGGNDGGTTANGGTQGTGGGTGGTGGTDGGTDGGTTADGGTGETDGGNDAGNVADGGTPDGVDTDGDGIADGTTGGIDTDGDGIADGGTGGVDSDSDDIADGGNPSGVDTDGDGLPDDGTTGGVDTDGDGVADGGTTGIDSDGDGVADGGSNTGEDTVADGETPDGESGNEISSDNDADSGDVADGGSNEEDSDSDSPTSETDVMMDMDNQEDPESDDAEDNINSGERSLLLATFCGTELKVTPIAGTDKVRAKCAGQALAYVFTQPKDELGNPIPFNQEQFPELLTGDEFVEFNGDTSWFFYEPDGKNSVPMKFSFDILR